jgi:hypothetical protein
MRLLPLLLVTLLLSSAARAQVRQGLQELNGSGSFTAFDDGSSLFVGLSYGYFVTRNAEIGPFIDLNRLSVDTPFGDESTTSGLIGGFGHLHFGRRGATSVPFLGLEIGAAVGDAEGVLFGVLGGGKFFVADGAALTPAAFFQFDDEGNSSFGARFGVSAFF